MVVEGDRRVWGTSNSRGLQELAGSSEMAIVDGDFWVGMKEEENEGKRDLVQISIWREGEQVVLYTSQELSEMCIWVLELM